jgi:hypothetical protein
MSQTVEVNLRLPVRAQVKSDLFPYGIADVRFIKTADLDPVPKIGDIFNMSAGPLTFPCKVTQRTWDESKDMFVVACEYGGTSRISNEDYLTILEAPDWTAKSLL